MKNKHSSPAEAQMRQRLSRALAQEDQKFGNGWKHSGGTLMRWCKGLYCGFSVYSLMVYVLNELILWAASTTNSALISPEKQVFFTNNGWIVHSLILLCLSALILQAIKKELPALIVQAVLTALSILQVVQVYVGEYENATLLAVLYYITFGGILALSGSYLIRLFDARRLNRAVEKEYQKIYERYGNEDDTLLSAEQLESILQEYEDALQKGETPSKS
ncbi:MAG: hypothetical protein IJP35_07310 [Clostridia bacterium]|nr:hypothetical protein [Clostridia bacterium]